MTEIAGEIQAIPRNPNGTYPKGVSGNPAGKPPGIRHMTTILKEALIKVSDDKGTRDDVEIVKTVARKAKEGDMNAIKLIWNYLDGMPPQDINANINGDMQLTVVTKVPESE